MESRSGSGVNYEGQERDGKQMIKSFGLKLLACDGFACGVCTFDDPYCCCLCNDFTAIRSYTKELKEKHTVRVGKV